MSNSGFQHQTGEGRAADRERRLQQLIQRLPRRMQNAVHWLRRPSARWVRIPAGLLLIIGGFLAVLPLFGLWMLPLGLVLLAEDIAALRWVRDRLLDWIEQHRPHWFGGEITDRANPSPRNSPTRL